MAMVLGDAAGARTLAHCGAPDARSRWRMRRRCIVTRRG